MKRELLRKNFLGFLIAIAFYLGPPEKANAQWQQTNGPTGGYIHCIATSGTNIFAGTEGGVFLSTNNGVNWTPVNNGITNTTPYFSVLSIAISGTNIFAGTNGGGVYFSSNNGSSWTAVNNGLSSTIINALAIYGSQIFAGTNGGGMCSSTNNGNTWTALNNGLTSTYILSLAVIDYNGTRIFAGTSGGVFSYNGSGWTASNNGMTGNYVYSLGGSGVNTYAGTNFGMFLSVNNGISWSAINTGLPPNILSIAISGSNLFAGTASNGVFLSTNNGASWTAANTGISNMEIASLTNLGANILAGTNGSGLFSSANNGSTWTTLNNGLTDTYNLSIAISGANIFSGTDGGGVFLSSNNGSSWTAVNNGLNHYHIYSLVTNGANTFAGTDGGKVFLTTNNGTNWTATDLHLTSANIQALAMSGTNIFAGSLRDGVFLSSDNGNSWTGINNGLTNKYVLSLAISGTNIFAGTQNGGVFLSTNNGSSWVPVNNGLTFKNIYSLAISGTNIFAGTEAGVYLSTNNGSSWVSVAMPSTVVQALTISGSTNIFAGTGAGMFLSTNNGSSWTAVNSGFSPNTAIYSIGIKDTNIFAGTNGSGIWKRPLSELTLPSGGWVLIPDANFRNAIAALVPTAISGSYMDTTNAQIISMTTLNVSNKNIQDLTGIQYFKSLTQLQCDQNVLVSLPALPPLLTFLSCSSNQLTSITVLPASLYYLDCGMNSISSLPALPSSLTILSCNYNSLTSLPALPASLQGLNCSSNNLSSLPSLPSSLYILNCAFNNLNSLPSLPSNLNSLDCGNNTNLHFLPTLTSIALAFLQCDNNGITILPVLPTTLQTLYCSNNPITALPSLPSSLIELYIENDQITCLPLLPPSLQTLSCNGNLFSCLPNKPPSLVNIYCTYTLCNAVSTSGNTTFCQGGSVTLTASGNNNYNHYTWNTGATTQSIVVSTTGNYSCSVNNSCGTIASNTTTVTVVSLPAATASSNSPVCSGTALNLSSGGGISYSWKGPNSFTSSQQNPVIASAAIANAGTYSVTVTNAGGCSAVVTTTVVVNAPNTSYYADADGDGFGNAALSQLACTKPAGYVTDNTDCNDADAGVHSPPTYFIDVDHDTYGSTATASVCASSPPAGYSVNNTDCNDNNASIHSPQPYYIDADHDGYGSTASALVCAVTPPVGYSANNTDCNDTNAEVNPGKAEIICNKIDDNCNGTVDEGGIIIPAKPGTINAPGGIKACPGDVMTYSIAAVSRALSYVWTAPLGGTITSGQGTTTITVTYGSGFTSQGTLYVRATNYCGSSSSASLVISRNVTSTPGAITVSGGSAAVCPGDARTYSIAAVAGATSYTWTAPAGATINSGQGTTSILVIYNSGFTTSGTLKVTADNACGSSTARTLTISRNNPVTPGTITVSGGASAVCPGDARIYTVTTVTGITYNWTTPTGAVITSGQGTNSIHLSFNTSFTASGTLSVTARNGCGTSGARTLTIPRNLPLAPGTITVSGGAAAVCPGDVRTYSVAAITGLTYNWIPAPGSVINIGQGTNSIKVTYTGSFTANGTLKVTATNACGTGPASSITIARNLPSTPGAISGSASVCKNTTVPYSISAVANATSYIWTVPAGATISLGQGTTGISVLWGITGGTITVKSSNACGISATRSLSVTVTCRNGQDDSPDHIPQARLFPNPTTGVVTLELTGISKGKYSIRVMDVTGRLMINEEAETTEGINLRDLDLGALTKGIYIITLQTSDYKKEMKVIVE